MMQIDPKELSPREVYQHMVRIITPRPIAWVSTCSASGESNLAPFSFFNGVGANPPTVVFCPVNRRDGSKKDTLLNVESTHEFVVNIVSFDQAEAMNQTSIEYEADISEFDAVGLTPIPSVCVKPPRLAESSVQLECQVRHKLCLGTGPLGGNLVVGEILMMHLDEQILDEAGDICPEKIDTIGRLGGASYVRTTDYFDMGRPENGYKSASAVQ